MARVNVGKLAAGGVLAGVLMNVVDYFTYNFILVADWDHVARVRNVDPVDLNSKTALAMNLGGDMLLGFLVVWTYVAIRPRLGAGYGTAVIAAFMVFAAEAILMATWATSFFSWDVWLRTSAMMLVATIVAALAGAWIYREEGDD